jgi:hypothetical protein
MILMRLMKTDLRRRVLSKKQEIMILLRLSSLSVSEVKNPSHLLTIKTDKGVQYV